MRKIILLSLTILIIISCSKDDDNTSTNFINPPNWIQGTWMDESEPEIFQIGGFQFTNNNILDLSSEGETLVNLKEGLQDAVDNGSITINETISDTEYRFQALSGGVAQIDYHFAKNDNNSIVYDLSVTYDVILTKQ